jgi:GTP-binding protein
VPRGGPSGGDGGDGGDVVLVADPSLRDLSRFRQAAHFKAERGTHGQGSSRHGRSGAALELTVPVGTQVRLRDDGRLVADLAHPGARVIVARGGRGGRGNRTYATATHQAPLQAQLGEPGEQLWLELRLKLVADAALLGFPNAGKSSLLRRISAARPKVADYPFTTVEPVLGVVEDAEGRQLTVADVPGLLEGASEGVGLGHEFLAHLERARLLLHVVEAAPGEPDQVAAEIRRRRAAIQQELERHGGGLAERPQLLVLSKIDLIAPEQRAALAAASEVDVACSAATGEGIGALRAALFARLEQEPPPAATAERELADYLVYRPAPSRRGEFRILRDAGVLRVAGRGLEQRASTIDPSDERDVARLTAEIRRLGVDEALRQAGARPGDEVAIGAHRFIYQPPPAADDPGDDEPE